MWIVCSVGCHCFLNSSALSFGESKRTVCIRLQWKNKWSQFHCSVEVNRWKTNIFMCCLFCYMDSIVFFLFTTAPTEGLQNLVKCIQTTLAICSPTRQCLPQGENHWRCSTLTPRTISVPVSTNTTSTSRTHITLRRPSTAVVTRVLQTMTRQRLNIITEVTKLLWPICLPTTKPDSLIYQLWINSRRPICLKWQEVDCFQNDQIPWISTYVETALTRCAFRDIPL